MGPGNELSSETQGSPRKDRRPTGINVVGDLPWGAHLCHFYETKSDLLDLVLPYLKAGLEQGEACLWVIPDQLSKDQAKRELQTAVPDAKRHLARGGIEILTHDEWYRKAGTFDIQAVIDRCTDKLKQVLVRGYAGLRLTGDGSWIRDHEREGFRQYEKDLSRLIASQRLLILCTYPLAQSGAAKILEVARFHQVALAKRKGYLDILETPALEQDQVRMQQRVIDDHEKLGAAGSMLNRRGAERTWTEELLVEYVHFCALSEKVARVLTETWDLRTALQSCAEALVEHLEAAFARIWTLDENGEVLELQASAGLYTRLNGTYSRIPVGSLKVGRIAQTRQPHLTNDVENDPEIDNRDWARMTGMVSFAGYPLVVKDELLGVIGLFARRPLSELTLQTVAANACAIALAIRRSKAEEALHKSEQKLARADEDFEFNVQKRTADLRDALAQVQQVSPNPEEASKLREQIDVSVQQMDQLKYDALQYCRVARQELSIAPINPKALLQSITDSNPEFQPPRAFIHIHDPMPPVLGSYAGLYHVFSNLLANAVKFVEAGRVPEVSIYAEPRSEWVRLWFQDNGIGIAEGFHRRLFHIFQRGTEEYPGTGLGLALAKTVVERMDGKIGVESALGQGSRFWVELKKAGDQP